MAETGPNLRGKLSLDQSEFDKGLKKSQSNAKQASSVMARAFEGIQSAVISLGATITALATGILALPTTIKIAALSLKKLGIELAVGTASLVAFGFTLAGPVQVAIAKLSDRLGPRLAVVLSTITREVSILSLRLAGAATTLLGFIGVNVKLRGSAAKTAQALAGVGASAEKTTTAVRTITGTLATVAGTAVKASRAIGLLGSVALVAATVGFALVIKSVSNLVKRLDPLIRKAIQFGDSIDKTSSKLGLTAEQLQEFQFVATQSGISTEKFNTALQRFLRRTGETRQGTGILSKEFDRLGISLTNANGTARDGIDVFQDYLGVIGDTGDNTEKLRLAFAGFDTEGVELVNVANQGREAFERLRQEAQELGQVMSNQSVKAAAELNDELDQLARQRSVLAQERLLNLAGVSLFLEKAKTEAAKAVGFLTKNLRDLEKVSLHELEGELEDINARIEELSAPSGIAGLALGAGSGALAAAKQQREELERVIALVRDQTGSLLDDIRASVRTIDIDLSIDGADELRTLPELFREIGEVARETENAFQDALAFDDVEKRTNEVNRQFAELFVALEESSKRSLTAQTANLENLRTQLETLRQISGQSALSDARRLEVAEQIRAVNALIAGAEQNILSIQESRNAAEQTLLRTKEQALALADQEAKIQKRLEVSARTSLLIQSTRSLLILADATGQTRREFERLSAEIRKGAVDTKAGKEEYEKLVDELLDLRSGLTKTAGLVDTTARNFGDLGSEASNARSGLDSLASGLDRVTSAADEANSSIQGVANAAAGVGAAGGGGGGGFGRAGTLSIGSVIRGDPSDPANIQAAISRLESQLLGVQKGGFVGFAGSGFVEIQSRALRQELNALQAQLVAAQQQQQRAIINAIIGANQGSTSEELEARIQEELALQRRLGLVGGGSSAQAGYQPSTPVRF